MTARTASSLPAALCRPSLGSLFVAFALVACGGGGSDGSDTTATQPGPSPAPPPAMPQPEPVPPPVASKGNVSLLLGTAGGAGNLDGAGAAARFNGPNGLAIGPTGDLYVADSGNRRIRKVTPAGVVSTVAGSGQPSQADGPAMQASLCSPKAVAVGPDSSIFVIDGASVRKIDAAGSVSTVAGAPPGDCSGRFVTIGVVPTSPTAIAVDAFGIAYIADSFAGAVYTLTPAGALTLLAGSADPMRRDPALSYPGGIALDAARNVFVASGAQIVRIAQTGEVTTLPLAPPPTTTLRCAGGNGLARDAAGNFYATDSWVNVVCKITPAGDVSIVAGVESRVQVFQDRRFDGDESVDGPLGTGRLATPQGVAVAADGTLYVSDNYGHTIRRVDPVTGQLSTFAGVAPRLSPFGRYHATDRAGNVFFAVAVGKQPFPDSYAVQRRAPDGTITTLLPRGLNAPRGMALDAAGNLYVVDLPAGSCVSCSDLPLSTVVRKITPQGELSIFAGRLETPSLTTKPDIDGTGAAAYLSNAVALAFGPAGDLYVTQAKNHPLRKITPEGVVSTVPVTLPANSGQYYPSGVAADTAGNVYLSTCDGFKTSLDPVTTPLGAAILKIDPSHNVTELAGSVREVGYLDGPGAQARFANVPSPQGDQCLSGLTLDGAGNLYVSDQGNDVVRKITPAGVVSTLVGQRGMRGVALGPLPASLSATTDLSLDGTGNLVIGSVDALLEVQFDK